MKIRRRYNDVFEGRTDPSAENLIFVSHMDQHGYIHYQFCSDPLKTNYKATETDLYEEFKRIDQNEIKLDMQTFGKGMVNVSEETIVINIPVPEEWTVTDLKYACKHNKVKGYTKMSKEQLVEAVKVILDHK